MPKSTTVWSSSSKSTTGWAKQLIATPSYAYNQTGITYNQPGYAYNYVTPQPSNIVNTLKPTAWSIP